jgi:hypothetical protein
MEVAVPIIKGYGIPLARIVDTQEAIGMIVSIGLSIV